MAMVHRGSGGYQIAVMDARTNQLNVLTQGRLDESPSFAPNGHLILYATRYGGRGVLAVTTADGRVNRRLGFKMGDVREPAWAPFTKERRMK